MTTVDAMTAARAARDPLDDDLASLFALAPTAATLDRLDRRVERAVERWRPRANRGSRLRPGRRVALLGLVAATVALGGANGSLQALYFLLAGPFDTPWHRGTDIGLSQTVDGYTVTIDRAYADATRLALAISVVDERQRAGTTQVMAFSTVVTDAAGEYTSGGGAVSRPDGAYAAVNVAWKQPPILPLPSGPRELHVVLPFIMVRGDATLPPDADAIEWTPWVRVPGPWTFDFEIDVDGGTAIEPSAVAETDGIRVTVPRLIAASSVVRIEMRIDGDLPADAWSPIGEVRHDDRSLRFILISWGPDGSVVIQTDAGVDDASGHWTVDVAEIQGGPADERRTGPWILEFDVP